jgi:hypothetical protein
MSNVTLVAAPAGVWKSGRVLISTTFNAATQSVGVVGSLISAGAEYATALEHTSKIDCALTVLTHRDTAIHAAAASIVETKRATHTASGATGTFDAKKAYTAAVAMLEAKVPS